MKHDETIADVGEFVLIDRIAKIAGSSGVIQGIGDDTAVLEIGGEYLLATVDMLVQDVHFRLDQLPAEVLGNRAVAVSFSDIAAMGGQPVAVLTSLALPVDVPVTWVEELYVGIRRMCQRFDASLVGGNLTTTSGPIAIDVTVLGRVGKHEVMRRSGAQPGDVLAVTGVLGRRAAARLALDAGLSLASFGLAIDVDLIPEPLVRTGQELGRSGLVHAAMDLSDGLAGDIYRLTQAGGVGAVLYASEIPIDNSTDAVARALGLHPLHVALTGGEDYELLFSLPPEHLDAIVTRLPEVPIRTVGTVLEAVGVWLEEERGGRVVLPETGWHHF